ncbi:MAG: MFS transporter [Chloroflexota bacterium]
MRHSPWQTHRLMIQPWQRTLAIIFFAQFVMVLAFGIIFPFLPLYIREIGSSTSLGVEFLAGLVFSAQAVTMMISSPIFGVLADRYSRKLITTLGLFGVGVTMWMMGIVNSAEGLIFWRAIQGLVAGGISAATALVAATAPKERVGFAMGMVQVALWGGVAAGPLVGGVLADARGYRFPFQITAVLMVFAGLIVWIGIKEPKSEKATKPETSSFNFWREWWGLLTAKHMPMIFSLRFLVGLGNMIIAPIAPLFILSLLPDSPNANTWTGLVSGVGGAASTITAVYFGRLGDRIGHSTILKFCAVAAGLFYLPQTFVTAAWQLLVLQALTGGALGGMITAIAALLARHSPPGEEGGVYGLDSAVFAASRVVAPLMGAAIASWIGLRSVFAFTGVLFLITAVLVIRGLAEMTVPTTGD